MMAPEDVPRRRFRRGPGGGGRGGRPRGGRYGGPETRSEASGDDRKEYSEAEGGEQHESRSDAVGDGQQSSQESAPAPAPSQQPVENTTAESSA